MESVALDKEMKQGVVNEVNTFLKPRTEQWFLKKGIPWRRGYLFHGPPGTGKTSLAIALAGMFGVPIYVVPLRDSDIEDAELVRIFASIPARSLVLLEDIDTVDVTSSRTASKRAVTTENSNRGSNISLSGLLNAIDGVTSPQGIILVMTTNHPESLDDALIRPGRIDCKVHFPLISKALARGMFSHVYQDEHIDLSALANEFAAAIPEDTLSAATVQKVLYAEDPKDAIARAAGLNEKVNDATSA
ncbi:hypothetical protein N0V95_009921 [Ascochyta clinopodiicola]|nr:hypothetical protein N0V95_009921 [Ascochyta clinopodiicola]